MRDNPRYNKDMAIKYQCDCTDQLAAGGQTVQQLPKHCNKHQSGFWVIELLQNLSAGLCGKLKPGELCLVFAQLYSVSYYQEA